MDEEFWLPAFLIMLDRYTHERVNKNTIILRVTDKETDNGMKYRMYMTQAEASQDPDIHVSSKDLSYLSGLHHQYVGELLRQLNSYLRCKKIATTTFPSITTLQALQDFNRNFCYTEVSRCVLTKMS